MHSKRNCRRQIMVILSGLMKQETTVTLDSYMTVGTDQYKWADGLYVKVVDIKRYSDIYVPSIPGITIF